MEENKMVVEIDGSKYHVKQFNILGSNIEIKIPKKEKKEFLGRISKVVKQVKKKFYVWYGKNVSQSTFSTKSPEKMDEIISALEEDNEKKLYDEVASDVEINRVKHDDYELNLLNSSISDTEEILKKNDLSEEDRIRLENQLTEYKADLEKYNNEKDNINNEIEQRKDEVREEMMPGYLKDKIDLRDKLKEEQVVGEPIVGTIEEPVGLPIDELEVEPTYPTIDLANEEDNSIQKEQEALVDEEIIEEPKEELPEEVELVIEEEPEVEESVVETIEEPQEMVEEELPDLMEEPTFNNDSEENVDEDQFASYLTTEDGQKALNKVFEEFGKVIAGCEEKFRDNYEQMKEQQDKKMQELDDKIAEYEEKLEKADKNANKLSEELEEITKEKDEVNKKLDSKDEQLSEKNKEINELKEENALIENSKNEQNETIENQEKTIGELKEDLELERKDKETAMSQKKVAEEERDLWQHRNEIIVKREEIREQKSRESEEKIKELKEENIAKSQQLNASTVEISAKETKIVELNNQLSLKDNEVDRLKSENEQITVNYEQELTKMKLEMKSKNSELVVALESIKKLQEKINSDTELVESAKNIMRAISQNDNLEQSQSSKTL